VKRETEERDSRDRLRERLKRETKRDSRETLRERLKRETEERD